MEIRVRGVKHYRSRGKLYTYHRKTGRRLREPLGSAAFLARIEALGRLDEAPAVGVPGSLGALIADYKMSPEFTELSPRTQADYRKVFDYFQPLAGKEVRAITTADVIAIRDAAFRAKKRRFAHYALTMLHLLFAWGKTRSMLEVNPASGVPKLRRPKGLPKANRRWTREELDVVLGAAPPELRLAIALGVCTGMRESDVLAFPWSGYKDGLIEGRAAKTGTPIWMPAHPMLMELLDAAPRKSPIVVIGARGRPYTQNGFQSRFFKLIRALKSAGRVAPGLTFHGLRTTTVTLLAEAGCDTQTIMAISGHATEAMVAHYRRDADQKDRAESAIARLNLRGERKADKSV